jgi:hypothetical protein
MWEMRCREHPVMWGDGCAHGGSRLPQVIVNARFALDVIARKAYIECRHQERWLPKEPSDNLEVREKTNL